MLTPLRGLLPQVVLLHGSLSLNVAWPHLGHAGRELPAALAGAELCRGDVSVALTALFTEPA